LGHCFRKEKSYSNNTENESNRSNEEILLEGDKMSIKNLNEAEISAVVELIKQQHPYREIMKKFPALKSTSMIARIKKVFISGEKPKLKKLSDTTKRKIQTAATERKALEKSDLIVNRYISVIDAFSYSITNLDEIQRLHKSETEKIFILLNEIIKRMDEFSAKSEMDAEDTLSIRTSLLEAANKVADIHKNSLLRIKAIDSLRGQMDSFLKFKIQIEGIEQINNLIKAFFKGTEVLNDEQYFRFKEAVIDYDKFARVFFDRWDAGVYRAAEPNQAVNTNEKDEAGSQHLNEQEQ
jgi:hypothetical protein